MAYITSPASARYSTPQRSTTYSPPVTHGQFDLYQTTQSPITTIRSSQGPIYSTQPNYDIEQNIRLGSQPIHSHGFQRLNTTSAREYGINLYENIRSSSIESTQTNPVRISNNSSAQIPTQRLGHLPSRPTTRDLLTAEASHSRQNSGVIPVRSEALTHMTTSVPLAGTHKLPTQPEHSKGIYRPLLPSNTMYMFSSGASHHSAAVAGAVEAPDNRTTPLRIERSHTRPDPFIRDSSVSVYLGETHHVADSPAYDDQTLAILESENTELRNQIQKTEEEKQFALLTNKLLLRKLVNMQLQDLAN